MDRKLDESEKGCIFADENENDEMVNKVMGRIRLPMGYLAPVAWYKAVATADEVVVEQKEHFVKQTWRNRCRIAMPDGPQDLVVPVVAAPNHTALCDIRISDHGNWRHHHWSALRTAYGKSPFFEYYADDFAPFYEKRYEFLADFTEGLRMVVSQLIDLETPVTLSEAYAPPIPFEELPVPTEPYYQVFRQRLGFLPNLSIVDLLFNLGPESLLYLK